MLGRLDLAPALDRPDLLAAPVLAALRAWPHAGAVQVAGIDPELADTEAFCAAYGIELAASANCVVVAGRRGEDVRRAACLVLATTRADVNGVVRRRLDARKASFAPLEQTVADTAMEYGGITPLGLPDGWPVLVDPAVSPPRRWSSAAGCAGRSSCCRGRRCATCRAPRCCPDWASRPRTQPV